MSHDSYQQLQLNSSILPPPQGHKMISAGREDVDVRMLGKGRPFVLELPNPHVARPDRVDLAAIEAALRADPDTYGGVEARGLRLVGPGGLRMLKEGEEDKQKRYLATVRLSRAVVRREGDGGGSGDVVICDGAAECQQGWQAGQGGGGDIDNDASFHGPYFCTSRSHHTSLGKR